MRDDQYENFNRLPREIGSSNSSKNTILAYYDSHYEGPVMVIDGSQLLAIMPDVEQGIMVASHSCSQKSEKQIIEILPSEAQHISHTTFMSWLKAR